MANATQTSSIILASGTYERFTLIVTVERNQRVGAEIFLLKFYARRIIYASAFIDMAYNAFFTHR